jgi:hypothetical protein
VQRVRGVLCLAVARADRFAADHFQAGFLDPLSQLLTRAQAEAWSKHGVNANAIAPGFFATPLTAPVGIGEDERSGRWKGKGKSECGIHTQI